ncbi:hypothetical protein GGR57DRAFT_511988 [Xylariaceae sp. FL1272]|nr:hypothetical protein GGR57DRAFT_511988 [Xylariaceae sp. FL1272]
MRPFTALTALLLAAFGHTYTLPADAPDGIYISQHRAMPIDGTSIQGQDGSVLVRIRDFPQYNDTVEVFDDDETRKQHNDAFDKEHDNFIKHYKDSGCTRHTMLKDEYNAALRIFQEHCVAGEAVPLRWSGYTYPPENPEWGSPVKSPLWKCYGPPGVMLAKRGNAFVYHCNWSCEYQHCGGGHTAPFEWWADKSCGELRGGWFRSKWDFTMGRDIATDMICGYHTPEFSSYPDGPPKPPRHRRDARLRMPQHSAAS